MNNVLSYVHGEAMETHMKFTVPGIMITALLVASPAFAQYTNTGNPSTPGASVTKDDTTKVTKQSKKHMASASHKKKHNTASASHKQKKHMASYKQRNHDKAIKSKAQTTGSGSTSAPGASINKDDTTPKSR
jgi:hypothetical protein